MIVNPQKTVWRAFGKSLLISAVLALIGIFFGFLGFYFGDGEAVGVKFFLQLLPSILALIICLLYTNKNVVALFRVVFPDSKLLPLIISLFATQLIVAIFVYSGMISILYFVDAYVGYLKAAL